MKEEERFGSGIEHGQESSDSSVRGQKLPRQREHGHCFWRKSGDDGTNSGVPLWEYLPTTHTFTDMDHPERLNEVLAVLRTRADDLRRRGIARAAVFGSVARGEQRPDSDIDIVVDLDRNNMPELFTYVGIQMDLAQWMGRDVHLAVRDGLRPYVRPEVERDAIYAF